MINHIACIMDGNRRWAKKQGLALANGATEGLNKIATVVDFCLAHNISYLSLYAFSIDNFKRSPLEQECYFNPILEHGEKQAQDMAAKNVRVRFVGDHSLFPSHVRRMINHIETTTASGNKMTLNMLFCYGGRQEILAAIQKIIEEVRMGTLPESALTENGFKNYLWLGNIPDPDLIIRTGFAQRLSSFLTYQAAYSELYFANCLWPDLTEKHLEEAVAYFNECKRNFGT